MEELNDKIAVSVQPFNGKVDDFATPKSAIPWWIYAIGGVVILIIGIVVFMFIRNRRKAEELEELLMEEQLATFDVEDINNEFETEGTIRRKQLEKMAKEKPEEFAKLLRSWIAEE